MEFLSHCIKRDPNKLAGRATSGMLIMLIVLSLLGWIYLTQASHVATTSRRIEQLQRQKAALERENMELTEEIAEWESVSRMLVRAQEQGFTPLALDRAEYVQAVASAAPPPPSEDPPEEGVGQSDVVKSASWFDSVASQFSEWARSDAQ